MISQTENYIFERCDEILNVNKDLQILIEDVLILEKAFRNKLSKQLLIEYNALEEKLILLSTLERAEVYKQGVIDGR